MREELVPLAQRIRGTWPHSETHDILGDESIAVAWQELGDLPLEQVDVALRVLAREGRRFAPSWPEIRGKAVELALDLPDWTSVHRQLRGIATQCNAAYWRQLEPRRRAALSRCSPAARAFAEHVGLRHLGHALTAGAFHGETTAEAQLRKRWEQFAHRAQRDVALAGLPSAGLAALERVNRDGDGQPRPLRDVVAGLLPAGEDEGGAAS